MPEINTIKKIKKIQLNENIYDIGTDWSNIENKPITLGGYGILDAYTKAQIDEIRNTALFTMYDNDLYDATLENDNGNVILFLFGYDSSNSPTCGLDKLTAEDYGKVWHIVLTFTKANLAGSKSVRVQEYKRGAQSAEDWQTYNNVAEGNVIRFDYTMSDSTVSILRLRLNARAGEQKVHVLITSNRQLDDVLDTKANAADVNTALATKADAADVTAALATKADANPLPAYCLTEIERVKTAVAAAANYGDVVFGLFTDLHFGDGANANDEAQKWNAIRCVRKIADESILDFVIQGGDLMTGGDSLPLEDYERDTYVLNRSQYEFNGSRAPLYTSKGDHDSNQSDIKISKSDFAKRTAPYMPKAVRSSAYPNNYYFDLPEKKTRVINIDTGTVMAGQSSRGADYAGWTNEQLFNWLLDEVLTEEVKTGWQFIIFSHAPCDYEWQFGMTKQFRSTHPNDTTNSQNAAKGSMVVLNDLLEAINSAGNFSTEKTSKHYELVHDSNRVLQKANETAAALGGDVYSISGIETTNYRPFVKTKNFSGWTSKARLILSGHCHCDRLNNSTLIPDGNGNYLRGNTSYAIAYTASAARAGFKSTQIPANSGKTYYNYCFGNNASDEHPGESAANVAWSHIQSRTSGEISEQLFDIWIVGGTYVKRVRFGAGAGSELLATSLEV